MKKRNKHNLSHYRLLTGDPGEALPVSCVEVLPGDSFDHTASVLVRCSPLLAPVMHRAQVRVHHFYVPNRIIWPASESGGWEAFMTQDPNGSLDVPTVTFANTDKTSAMARLYEYLGCPLASLAGGSLKVSQLAARAYWSIWNEWYRDQDLENPINIADFSVFTKGIQRVSWRKDMFTSARTSPQQGSDITLPLGTTAPVYVNQVVNDVTPAISFGNLEINQASHATLPGALRGVDSPPGGSGLSPARLTGVADLSSSSVVSVRDLREAMALQRYAERMSQFGHRYSELLLSMGVKSSDGRIGRPEYLGGGKTNISFSEVLQTAEGTAPVGEMRGHGIAPARTQKYRRFFEEHGFVISILSVVPEAVYANAVPRHFYKGFTGGLPGVDRVIDDYYQPELERIGQQAIFKKELYPNGTSAQDDAVFGYNDRYYEYRHHPSQVMGDFLPGRSLDYWTWARSFASQPTLNQSFIQCDPGKRVFVDQTTEHKLWCAVNHRIVARRLVTKNVIGRTF